VGGGRLDHLGDVASGRTRRKLKQCPGVVDVLAPDLIGDQAGLARRDADVLGGSPDQDGFVQVDFGLRGHQSFPPVCDLKVRVGANSPSLWPTIDSEMKMGTCLRPSWTAIVCP